jgi:tripartite-type tricarboxylate transporter receptor subunit TctC
LGQTDGICELKRRREKNQHPPKKGGDGFADFGWLKRLINPMGSSRPSPKKRKGGHAMRTSFLRSSRVIFWVMILSSPFLFFSPVWGLDYPTKPIHLVASASAGGPSDLHARILGEAASKELGVPIVVINKPGPGGALGASFVATEKPDGYNYLVTQSGTLTSNFALFPNLPYKRTDLLPLFRSILIPCFMAVKADAPWKTFQDFLDDAKKNPGKLRSGAASANLSLLWRGLLKQGGLDVTHLMYKGAADSLIALMGGHMDIFMDAVTPLVSHIQAGKVRLLATIGAQRFKSYPDVPTLAEFGYPNYSKNMWNGFYAPAGLPEPIMDKFVSVFRKVLSQPSVEAQLEKVGVFGGFIEPKEFANYVDGEYRFYMELYKEQKK